MRDQLEHEARCFFEDLGITDVSLIHTTAQGVWFSAPLPQQSPIDSIAPLDTSAGRWLAHAYLRRRHVSLTIDGVDVDYARIVCDQDDSWRMSQNPNMSTDDVRSLKADIEAKVKEVVAQAIERLLRSTS